MHEPAVDGCDGIAPCCQTIKDTQIPHEKEEKHHFVTFIWGRKKNVGKKKQVNKIK